MLRKFLFLWGMALAMLFVVNANFSVCEAGGFQKLYEVRHVSDTLRSDGAWKKSFNTMNGEIKLQFRKVSSEGSDKRFHFTVKLGKNYVYKNHFPDVEGGYSIMVVKDTNTSRIFFVVQSMERAYMYGYEEKSKRFEIYIDSQNYLNRYNGCPRIAVLRNGDLVLAFEPAYANYVAHNQRYSFFWDQRSLWFAYKDLGGGFSSVDRDAV